MTTLSSNLFFQVNYSKRNTWNCLYRFVFFFKRRSSLIPNREKLKTFIRAYAIRLGNRADSPWIFYDQSIVEKYQLNDRISPDIIDKFRKSSTITLDVRHTRSINRCIPFSCLGNSSRTRSNCP